MEIYTNAPGVLRAGGVVEELMNLSNQNQLWKAIVGGAMA